MTKTERKNTKEEIKERGGLVLRDEINE